MAKSNSEGNEDEVQQVNPDKFKKFVKRIQNLEQQKRDLASDIAHVYLEAKNAGVDTKGLKRLIVKMRKPAETLAHDSAIDKMYEEIVGLENTPLGNYAAGKDPEDDGAEAKRKGAISRFKNKKGKKAAAAEAEESEAA